MSTRDAHRRVDHEIADRQGVVAADGCAEPLGGPNRLALVSHRHHGNELVAAVPHEQIAVANRIAQPAGHDLEHFVADQMTVGVVDALEVVEVDDHDRSQAPLTDGLLADLTDSGLEGAAVPETRERIVAGLVGE